MALDFSCGGCGQRYQVADSLAGRRIKCQKCGTPVMIPSAPAAPAPAAAPAGAKPRPVLQTFTSDPAPARPRPKPALQTFGAAAAPGRAAPPPPPIPKETAPTDVFGLDDDGSAAPSPGGYAVEEDVYAPPKAPLVDDGPEGAAVGRPGMDKPKKKKRSREPSGFWRRFGALFVDGFVLFGLNFALGTIALIAIRGAGRDAADLGAQIIIQILAVIVAILYFAASHSSANQATSGKRALGLIVTDNEGQPISFGRSLLREVVKQALGMICVGTIASFFTILFTPRKQALHDMIVGTVVVRSR